MKSMTGFGTASGEYEGRFFNVEIKSVNNRFREVIVRLPKICQNFEKDIKDLLTNAVERGRVDLWLQFDDKTLKDENLKINEIQAEKIITLLNKLKEITGLTDKITLTHLLNYNVISYEDEELAAEPFLKFILELVNSALNNLLIMRENEGQNLAQDLKKRLKKIAGNNNKIMEMAKNTSHLLYEKLLKRINDFKDLPKMDDQRLHQEVAFLADKIDITEENVRLQSHIMHFATICKTKKSIGRKLDFLLQEMVREVNTIGSKAQDVEVTNLVLELKSELEKIREQVQNIE